MRFNPVYLTLMEAAQNWPDAPAVYDEFGMITFRELFEETDKLREKLVHLGVHSGMGVGVMARNSRYFIEGIFAVIGCGATAMPMSHQLKENEIADILVEAKLHAILDDGHGVRPLIKQYQEISVANETFRLTFSDYNIHKKFAPHVEYPAFMRFTSGTTGKSKGVIISQSSAIERVVAANKVLNLGPGDTVVWVLPMAYHFVVSILLYVRFGAAIAIVKDFLPKNIAEMAEAHNGTLLYASPMQIRLLANSPEPLRMPSLKMVISTSAAISSDVCIAFKKKYGISVSQAYGIIEIGLPMINHLLSDEHPEAVGQVLPDYQAEVFDDNNMQLPEGEIGRLGIRGPGMFDAYLSPPAMREEVLVNGFFLTADYAIKSPNGLIKIEGREKSVINISGNKVFPEEVEGVLETIPEIKIAKISGIPHPLMGQIVQAEVVLENNSTIDIEAVLTYCRKRLSTFKVPQRVLVVDELPMTASGKLIRY